MTDLGAHREWEAGQVAGRVSPATASGGGALGPAPAGRAEDWQVREAPLCEGAHCQSEPGI
jgi:hypothetical protein